MAHPVPPFALRAVPAGQDPFAHRGARNLVRVAPNSFLKRSLFDELFTSDPTDAGTSCIDAHVLEGLYARVLTPEPDASMLSFGGSYVGVDTLGIVDTQLGAVAQPTLGSLESLLFVLNKIAVSGGLAGLRIAAAAFEANQPFHAAVQHDTWLSDLRPLQSGGSMCSWADLALLAGPRHAARVRLLSSGSRFSNALVAVARRAVADEGLAAPPAVAGVAGIPGHPYVPGRGRGRGRIAAVPAVPPVPAVPARPFPSTDADDDILGAAADWLVRTTLPIELQIVPQNDRSVRLEIGARTGLDQRALIRTRFNVFLECFPALARVLAGSHQSHQISCAERMALSLQNVPDTLDNVAAYHALEQVVRHHSYALDSDGGAAAQTIDARVQLIVDADDQSLRRRDASSKPTADGGASSDASLHRGAPAFSTYNNKALEQFIASHTAPFMAALRAVDAKHGDSALASANPIRILRVAFNAQLVAVMQFLVIKKADSMGEIFSTLAAYKLDVPKYISAAVLADAHGRLDRELAGVVLDSTFISDFIQGRRWSTLDILKHTEGRIAAEQQAPWMVHFPSDVFRSRSHLETLRDRGDLLFGTLGYPIRALSGFFGCVDLLVEYVKLYGTVPETNPLLELRTIYDLFMEEAMANYVRALEGDAMAPFPPFSSDTAAWRTRLDELIGAARRKKTQFRLEGASASRFESVANAAHNSTTALAVSWKDRLDGAYAGTKRSLSPGQSDGRASPVHSALKPDPSALSNRSPRAQPDGAAAQAPGTIGCNKHWVERLNASIMRIRFPRKAGGSAVYEWKVPECQQLLLAQEGSKDFCLPCAVCKNANMRYTLCQCIGQQGHRSVHDRYHNFRSDPWNALSGPTYRTYVPDP